MALRKWQGLIGAVVGAVVLLVVQIRMSALLAFEVKGIPALVPDVRIRVLLDVFVFVAALMACYRPRDPSEAGSFKCCCFRGLLWAVLLAGFCFESGSLLRISLLPVPLHSMAGLALVVFAFVWIAGYGFFASEALERRRELNLSTR